MNRSELARNILWGATLVAIVAGTVWLATLKPAAIITAAPAPRTVTMRVTTSNGMAIATFADPSGQSSRELNSNLTDQTFTDVTAQVPAGGTVTATITALNTTGGEDEAPSLVICAIYDGSDVAKGVQLTKHASTGVTTPTICTWTNS